MQEFGVSTCDEVSDLPSSRQFDSLDCPDLPSPHQFDSLDCPDLTRHTYDEAADLGEDDPTYTPQEDGDAPRLPSAIEAVLRGVWPFEKALWHSSPATVGHTHSSGAQVNKDIRTAAVHR